MVKLNTVFQNRNRICIMCFLYNSGLVLQPSCLLLNPDMRLIGKRDRGMYKSWRHYVEKKSKM